jgi:hypothetical protein
MGTNRTRAARLAAATLLLLLTTAPVAVADEGSDTWGDATPAQAERHDDRRTWGDVTPAHAERQDDRDTNRDGQFTTPGGSIVPLGVEWTL